MDVDFSFWLTLATLVVFVLWLLDRLLLSRVSARRFERARQLNAYAGSLQAAVGNHVIAEPLIKALRKMLLPSVTAATSPERRSCWPSMPPAKKRMKQLGRVSIPQDAFPAVLRIDD